MKKNKKNILIVTLLAALAVLAALLLRPDPAPDNADANDADDRTEPAGPVFNADSAYAFTAAQCRFGPRPMNTDAHERCGEWIIRQFKRFGCTVTTQKAPLRGYDGTVLHATNIIASFRPETTARILLCAHWDSRPWADNDPDTTRHRTPILAANDGASGVAVMLEIARLLADSTVAARMKNTQLGIDFVCFDAEDWGTPTWSDIPDNGESWALGAQYWADHVPEGYAPRYGILLDMVGGQGARFYQEGMSKQYAPQIVRNVWQAARQAGYASFFPRSEGGMVTDDHLPVNQVAGIPCIDIIPYYPDCPQSSFGPTWHTLDDNLEHIDRQTLKAVGQTLIQVIFTEE